MVKLEKVLGLILCGILLFGFIEYSFAGSSAKERIISEKGGYLYKIAEDYKKKRDYKNTVFFYKLLALSFPPDSTWVKRVSGALLWEVKAEENKRFVDLALDKDGNIWVLVDEGKRVIDRIDKKGRKWLRWSYGKKEVREYSPKGELLKKIDLQKAIDKWTSCLENSKGKHLAEVIKRDDRRFFFIQLDKEGNVYLTHDLWRIIKIDSLGNYLADLGKCEPWQKNKSGGDYTIEYSCYQPSGPYPWRKEIRINFPDEEETIFYLYKGRDKKRKRAEEFAIGNWDIDTDKYGNIYIAEVNASRIQIFDVYGRFLERIDSPENWSIEVNPDNGLIYCIAHKGAIGKRFYCLSPSKYFFYSELGKNLYPEVYAPKGNFIGGRIWRLGLFDESLRYHFQALSLLKKNKISEAIRYLDKELALNRDLHTLSGLARAYRHIGYKEKSKEILRESIKLYPERYYLYLRLSTLYGEEENYKEAAKVCEEGEEKVKSPEDKRILRKEGQRFRNFFIYGYIKDIQTKLPVKGVKVWLTKGGGGEQSDEEGYYEILTRSHTGWQSYNQIKEDVLSMDLCVLRKMGTML